MKYKVARERHEREAKIPEGHSGACHTVWKAKTGSLLWPRSLRVAWTTQQVSILKKEQKERSERGDKGRGEGKKEGGRKRRMERSSQECQGSQAQPS